MSKIIGICLIFVLIAFSTQSDECEQGLKNAVECLDRKVSLAKVEIDKKNEAINRQKLTIEKLKQKAYKGNDNEDTSDVSTNTNPIVDWRKECGLSNEGKWTSSGSSSTTSAPGTGVTIAPGVSTFPPQTCSIFCPTRPGSTTPPKEDVEGFLTDKINTIKKVLGLLGPIFGSEKPAGPLDGVLSGLNKLLDNIVKAVVSGVKGDLGPLQNLVNGLDLLLAKLPKEEAPVETPTLPRALPTRVKRQGITLLGLEGLIKNVLMLVRQLLNDLLPALQKLLKDIGPDLLNLLDKLLGSLRELLDKVLTGLINALGGNSNLLSALSGGLSLLGMLG